MDDEIVVRYRWTADEMLKGWHWYFRQLSTFPYWGYWALMGISMVLPMLVWWRSRTLPAPLIWVGLVAAAVGFCYPFFCLVLMPWIFRRQFARRPDRDLEVEWRISGEKIHVSMKIASSELTWAALAKVVRVPEGFLLCPIEQSHSWLPRHGFASEEDFERLAQLAQQHARAFRRIG